MNAFADFGHSRAPRTRFSAASERKIKIELTIGERQFSIRYAPLEKI